MPLGLNGLNLIRPRSTTKTSAWVPGAVMSQFHVKLHFNFYIGIAHPIAHAGVPSLAEAESLLRRRNRAHEVTPSSL